MSLCLRVGPPPHAYLDVLCVNFIPTDITRHPSDETLILRLLLRQHLLELDHVPQRLLRLRASDGGVVGGWIAVLWAACLETTSWYRERRRVEHLRHHLLE